MEAPLRIRQEVRNGIVSATVSGVMLFQSNDVEVPPAIDPRVRFFHAVFGIAHCSVIIGTGINGIHGEQMLGAPGERTWTPVGMSAHIHGYLGPAYEGYPGCFIHETDAFPSCLPSYEDGTDAFMEELIGWDQFAILGRWDRRIAAETVTGFTPVPDDHDTILAHLLEECDFVVTPAYDGWQFELHSRDADIVRRFDVPLRAANDAIASHPWYIEHAAELVWDYGPDPGLKLPGEARILTPEAAEEFWRS